VIAVVCTTVPSVEVAERVARALVEEQLAACVQRVGPITSTYRWKGAVTTDEEFQLSIKTTPEHIEALVARLLTLHPYEVPEVLVLDARAPHAPYRAWLEASVLKSGRQR
jgi:periplasmic divalent cation tolerance protein